MTRANILIIEDDGILAIHIQDMLSRLGYTVMGPLATGEEAVALMTDLVAGKKPDLVLMDIELAGAMSGIAAAEIISQTSDVPIVFLTGFSQDPLLEKAKIAGPYGYLIKPVPERELAAAVEMALHRHKLDRQLKESQADLAKSEAKFRHLFENSPLGIFRTSLDGKALAVNTEMARIVGCATAEETLRDFTNLAGQLYVDPHRRTEILALLKKHGEVNHFEFEARKKNGEVLWISMNARLTQAEPINGQAGTQVIDGFAMDITKRKQAEQATRESEEALRALVASLPDVVMRFDRKGRHLFVSENVNTTVDFEAAQFIGKTHQELGFPGDLCALWEQSIQKVFDSNEPFETEFTLNGKQGSTIHNWRLVPEQDGQGRVNSVISLSRDITAHRRAEQNFQTLFREMLDGFALHEIICDQKGEPTDYRFLNVNPAFEQLTGLKAENIVGRTVREIFPHTEPYWIQTYGRVALTGEPAFFENYSSELHKYFEVTAFRPAPNQFASIVSDITERKQAEDSLREAQSLIERIINTIPVRVFWKDKNLIYQGCNTIFARDGGFEKPGDIIGKTDFDMAWKNQAQLYRADDLSVIESGDPKLLFEEPQTTPDGNTITLLTNKIPLRNIQGEITGVLGTYMDITDRKKAEETLKESETRFRTLADSGKALVWTAGLDKKCDYFNQVWLSFTGRTLDQELGDGWAEGVHPEDLDLCVDIYTTSFDRRAPFSMDYRLRRHDGVYRWVQDDGSPRYDSQGNFLGYIGHCLDITEQKQASAALKEKGTRIRALFDATADSVFLLDPAGTILDLNEHAAKRRGATVADLIGQSIYHTLDPDQAEKRRQAVETAITSRIMVLHEEERHGRSYGIRIFPIFNDSGKVVQLASFSRDNTERNQTEQEKAKLQEQLAQAQKLEGIGQLAGGIAHDFNNLLSPILGYTEMLQDSLAKSDKRYEWTENVRIAADRSKDLVRQLLIFSRKQASTMQIVDINEVIRRFQKILQRTLRENIDLTYALDESPLMIWSDSGQVEQIIMNLSVNAQDAMPQGGKLTIGTKPVILDQAFTQAKPDLKPGPHVLFQVQDTGSGIDQATMEHIFEPFFSTKEVGKGTGLGLATVYGIVKDHKGCIQVSSEPGQGTVFQIYFPVTTDAPAQLEEKAQSRIQTQGKETVLVVEDDNLVRGLIETALKNFGYTVISAGSPLECLKMIKAEEITVDLLLTDVVMPGLNGPQLFKTLNDWFKGLKVLYISGYTQNILEEQGLDEQTAILLHKPFTVPDLLTRVRETLDQTNT